MAFNIIALAETMTNELDGAVSQKSCTGFLSDNGLQAKFVGSGKVQIPNVDFSGLGNYDRESGFVKGAITVTNTAYDLKMDRARSFLLDAQDCDESGIAGLSGHIMGEFVKSKVVPEMDAYVLSKLATNAEFYGYSIKGPLPQAVYSLFVEHCNRVYDVVGYDEELVAFVNSEFWGALQSTSEITRMMTINDNNGNLVSNIHSINGVRIIPVPDGRMKNEFTFYDGKSTGSIERANGGFSPLAGADSVGMLIMPVRAASLVKKTENIRIFDPSQNLNADAWKFDYRVYYDLFVKDSMQEAMTVYIKE